MRAPDFWGAPAGPVARALAPLGALYGAAARARLVRPAPRANIPTIAIGGVTLGGDGKTPTALALGAILLERGERPFFLSRGHGRRNGSAAPFVVDPARHDARDVGDEALLLARVAPTIVGADRAAAARLAETLGAGALILDDGLHSRRLDPDLAILVVDADYGAGNGFCPPAGPLRAPLAAQLAAADLVIVIGEGRGLREPLTRPAFPARLAPDPAVAARIAGARVFAFAGIGRPAKFANTLDRNRRRRRRLPLVSRSSSLFAARTGGAGAGDEAPVAPFSSRRKRTPRGSAPISTVSGSISKFCR